MLGVPIGRRSTVLSRLAGMPAFHRAVRGLRLLDIASRVLAIRPVKRMLKGGTRYRVATAEGLLMADEIFEREIYREAFDGRDVRSFVDLGSNAGYFTCYAMEYTGRRDLVGLAVDAHPAMAAETAWHIEENGLSRVKRVHGIVGFTDDVGEATFYINPSSVSCSAQPVLNPNVPAKGVPKPTTVPTVNLMAEWTRHAGDLRIDLLKIDVEGFEQEVLRTIPQVLNRTDAVVVEWHKWINPRESLDALLEPHGLRLARVISEDPHSGVALYDRSIR